MSLRAPRVTFYVRQRHLLSNFDHEAMRQELIDSPLGWSIERNGRHVKVNVVRLATEPGWSLEVVNDKSTSTVWEDLFETDRQADAAFRRALAQDGFEAFLD